jgi:hypothetical protein
VPVFHEERKPITATNLGERLRETGGKIGGIDACSIPGLPCGSFQPVNRSVQRVVRNYHSPRLTGSLRKRQRFGLG